MSRKFTRGLTLVHVAVWMLLATLTPVRAHDQVPGEPQTVPILLRGGDLYTVTDGVKRGTDLLFEDGKITRIGRSLEAPDGAKVIDVRGKRVYPGLIAMQTQIGLVEIGAVRATRDQSELGGFTPEVAAYTAFNYDSEIIPTVRSEGITTAQVTPTGGTLSGQTFVTHLDGWNREDGGVRLREGLTMSWPRATVRRAWWVQTSEEEQLRNMREQRERLRDTFDAARAYHALRAAEPDTPIDLRWEAMRPVMSGEAPLYISADDYRQIVEAVDFAEEYDVRAVLVGGEESWRALDLLSRHDVPVVLGTVQTTPQRQDDDYDLPFKLPSLLEEAGVRFALSLPTSWGVRSLAFQAGQAVAFGLSEETALRSVTLTPAEMLGIDDRQGSLEPGKDATLFVSGGDVFDYLGHSVQQMFIEGREVDLDDRHKKLWRKYRNRIED